MSSVLAAIAGFLCLALAMLGVLAALEYLDRRRRRASWGERCGLCGAPLGTSVECARCAYSREQKGRGA